MTLPDGISTCTLTVRPPSDFDGDTMVMNVEWQPILDGKPDAGIPHSIVWATTGQALVSFAETDTSSDGGALTVHLPHVDQTGFIDGKGNDFTMWAYKVHVTARDERRKTYTRTKYIQVLVGQDTAVFDLIEDGQVTVGVTAPSPTVISVNGETGAVTTPSAGDVTAALEAAEAAQTTADAAQTTADAAQAGLGSKADTTALTAETVARTADVDSIHDALTAEAAARTTDVNTINTALTTKADLTGPGGTVVASQLPSYVDDVLEFANLAAFPAVGETGKIYVAKDTNLTYRWSGSVYGVLDPSLALGETVATAYRGDRGKVAYDFSQSEPAARDAAILSVSTARAVAMSIALGG